jgi:hypothetical protein
MCLLGCITLFVLEKMSIRETDDRILISVQKQSMRSTLVDLLKL